jgi:hypothetical protein
MKQEIFLDLLVKQKIGLILQKLVNVVRGKENMLASTLKQEYSYLGSLLMIILK